MGPCLMNPCNNSERRGQVAEDPRGKPGVVTHEVQYFDSAAGRYRTRYVGFDIIGDAWETSDPRWVALSIFDFIANVATGRIVYARASQAAPVSAGPDPVPH